MHISMHCNLVKKPNCRLEFEICINSIFNIDVRQ